MSKECPLCKQMMHKLGVLTEATCYYSDDQWDDLEIVDTKYTFCVECGQTLPEECDEEWFDDIEEKE